MGNQSVLAVVGGQYGSEGKGVVVNHLANQYTVHVRTGGPNAGHSIKHRGQVYKMQVVPCGWTNPDALVVIGRGALLDLHQLKVELELIAQVDESIYKRLSVDFDCMILDKRHHAQEGGTEGDLHRAIGSTGEGVGAARLARVARDPARIEQAFMQDMSDIGNGYRLRDVLGDTVDQINTRINKGHSVLLEGTQGFGLSLIHGPWPYCTSHDTTAATLCADAGISPLLLTDVILVCRTYPIRVAGNSGPLFQEMSWADLSKRVGEQIIERTTVTNKVRRVGEWDPDLVFRSTMVNRPTGIAMMFGDYRFPEEKGKMLWDQLAPATREWVESTEKIYGPIFFLGTGGPNWSIVETPTWKNRVGKKGSGDNKVILS